jgi:hypothetical protein
LEFPTWKRKVVPYLSENRDGVLLSKVVDCFGKPRGFETAKEAIESIPGASVNFVQSSGYVAILQTDADATKKTVGSPSSNILNAQQRTTNQNKTKAHKQQTRLLLPSSDILKSSLAWTLSPEIEHMWKYLDQDTGEEVLTDAEMEDV